MQNRITDYLEKTTIRRAPTENIPAAVSHYTYIINIGTEKYDVSGVSTPDQIENSIRKSLSAIAKRYPKIAEREVDSLSLYTTAKGCADAEAEAGMSDLQDRFNRLIQEWKQATAHHSISSFIFMHPAYQQMIGMGPVAVFFILRRLTQAPDHLFWALRAITGENPVRKENRGYLDKMTEDWLRWGKSKGYEFQ